MPGAARRCPWPLPWRRWRCPLTRSGQKDTTLFLSLPHFFPPFSLSPPAPSSRAFFPPIPAFLAVDFIPGLQNWLPSRSPPKLELRRALSILIWTQRVVRCAQNAGGATRGHDAGGRIMAAARLPQPRRPAVRWRQRSVRSVCGRGVFGMAATNMRNGPRQRQRGASSASSASSARCTQQARPKTAVGPAGPPRQFDKENRTAIRRFYEISLVCREEKLIEKRESLLVSTT